MRERVRNYYQAWVDSDRAAARALLAPDLTFESPSDLFHSAEVFLDCCWQYADSIHAMEWEYEVYGDDEAMVSYRAEFPVGAHRVVEHLRFRDNQIASIHVLAIHDLKRS